MWLNTECYLAANICPVWNDSFNFLEQRTVFSVNFLCKKYIAIHSGVVLGEINAILYNFALIVGVMWIAHLWVMLEVLTLIFLASEFFVVVLLLASFCPRWKSVFETMKLWISISLWAEMVLFRIGASVWQLLRVIIII